MGQEEVKEKRVIHWASFVATASRILLWGILVFAIVMVARFYKKWARGPETITVTQYISLPQPAENIPNSWLNKKVKPDTIIIDTSKVRIDTVYYANPWGICDLSKARYRLEITAFRPVAPGSREVNLRSYIWTLTDGKDFHIYSTKDAKNPFELKERRDWFDVSMEIGWSAVEKPYVETGVWFNGLNIKNYRGDIGLTSRVSFKWQTLCLGYKVTF
jgi:hypothetical protein